MKKLYLVLFPIILLTACKKNELPGDNGCISRTNGNYVTGADATAATQLLKKNNLPYEDALFSQVLLHDTIPGPDGNHIYQHIVVVLQFNGLPLLSNSIYYHFKDGILASSDGTRYKSISVNFREALSLPQVRKLYIGAAIKGGMSAADLNDTCLAAQLGYYDLNTGTGNSSTNFVRVWSVTPKNSQYPIAIIRDDNGQTISYNSGIVFF